MIIGILALAAGAIFLILNLVSKPAVADGEYLISAKEWKLEDSSNCANSEASEEGTSNCETPAVVWKFTEAGKGTLTTNGHANDYDFIWALEENNTLKIETKWLYDLDNTYTYELDKNKGTMTLSSDGKQYTFTAVFENAE